MPKDGFKAEATFDQRLEHAVKTIKLLPAFLWPAEIHATIVPLFKREWQLAADKRLLNLMPAFANADRPEQAIKAIEDWLAANKQQGSSECPAATST